MSARVHVVVVTYEGSPWIGACLDSLAQQQTPLIVHVVDNASSDETCTLVAAQPGVRLTRLAQNLGFGRGNNVGIAAALREGAEYVLLVNQDAVVLPSSLDTLVDFMDHHPAYGCCSPLHCGAEGERPDAKTLSSYLAPYAAVYLADAIAGTVQEHYRVHGINAAAWLIRAQCLATVGGFDPLFFMYGEDDDLLDRMAYHRVAFALVPAARVVHLRQSRPTPPPHGRWQRILRVARWEHSRLLLQCKRPGHSLPFIVLLLVLRGLLEPLIVVAIDRDSESAAGRWLATLKLLLRSPVLARHARTTAQTGAHFLQ